MLVGMWRKRDVPIEGPALEWPVDDGLGTRSAKGQNPPSSAPRDARLWGFGLLAFCWLDAVCSDWMSPSSRPGRCPENVTKSPVSSLRNWAAC
jgi:hypothetical protein